MHPLLVAATAFAVVLVAMTLLTVVFVAFRHVARRLAPGPAPAADATPPALVAVLAAAASEALGTAVRLHRVHVHRGSAGERWSRAGRMDIMISHRVEPKR